MRMPFCFLVFAYGTMWTFSPEVMGAAFLKLPPRLARRVCSGKPLHPSDLLREKFFAVNMATTLMSGEPSSIYKKQFAHDQLSQYEHFWHQWINCSPHYGQAGHSAALISAAPPSPPAGIIEGHISIRSAADIRKCMNYKIGVTLFDKAHVAIFLNKSAGRIKLPTGSGSYSISCQTYRHPEHGFQLWWLEPFSSAASAKTENSQDAVYTLDPPKWADSDNLIQWINRVRISFGRGKITTVSLIDNKMGKLRHHLPTLIRTKDKLTSQGFTFIGENKVLGDSPKEQALLLWLSPSHKQLLLEPSATHIMEVYHPQMTSLRALIFAKRSQKVL